MRMMKTLLFSLALSSLGLVLSCDDEHDESRPAECKEIQEACHGPDRGSGPIHECHENAEGKWTQAECASNKTMCLNLCRTATDGGATGG